LSFAETLGQAGTIIVAVATALFAFSTLIGWSYYGEKAIEYLLDARAIIGFRIVFVAMVMVGATRELSFVWNFSDLMNGLMAIPNLIGILLLSKVVKAESERYFAESYKTRGESNE
jgi:AGCS family alanine or glycine:cation symporter